MSASEDSRPQPHGPVAGRLIAIDVDGTLLQPDGTVADETIAAVQAAGAAGGYMTIATGRDWGLITEFMGLMPAFGHGICINGTEIRNASGSVLHSWSVDEDVASAAIDAIRSAVPGASIGIGTSEALVGEALVAQHMPLGVGELGTVDDATVALGPGIRDLVVCHADYIDDVPGLISLVRAAVADLSSIEVAHTGLPMAELIPVGTGKHAALAWLAESLGIDQQDVIAIGDGMNDLSMLGWAGTAVVMGQAADRVKEHAQIVIESNANHGLANYLNTLSGQ